MSRFASPDQRLRLIGLLIGCGLAVEFLTLFSAHHLSFMLFSVGAASMGTGVVLFFYWAVVRRIWSEPSTEDRS